MWCAYSLHSQLRIGWHKISQLQIGWHRILRLCLKLCQRTRIRPWDLRLVPGNDMALLINHMRNLVRLVPNWVFLEIISRFCASLPAIGCTLVLTNRCCVYKLYIQHLHNWNLFSNIAEDVFVTSWLLRIFSRADCLLQHPATHCNKLQHTATHCNTLQHTATHCNTLQHTATHCICSAVRHQGTYRNTLQHTVTHCNTLQHTSWVSGGTWHPLQRSRGVWWSSRRMPMWCCVVGRRLSDAITDAVGVAYGMPSCEYLYNMYVFVFIYIYIYIYVCVCIYPIHIHVYLYIHMYTYMYMYIYT